MTELEIKIPPFLQHNQRTMDANLATIITKTRWVVEARNGHIKSIFKFFNDSLCMDHIVNTGDCYKIAAAVMNRFHQPIEGFQGAGTSTCWKINGQGMVVRQANHGLIVGQDCGHFRRTEIILIVDFHRGQSH